jgi:hypothetical protein
VKVTADGCLDTLWCQTVAAPEPEHTDLAWKVWPNPADDFIYVEASEFSAFEIALFNSQGHAVRREKATGRGALSSASLSAGFYFLEIREGQRIVSRRKVIIAH